MCAYVRYLAHLDAYLWLVGNPYPGFVGDEGEYPIDIELPEPVAAAALDDVLPALPRDPGHSCSRIGARRRRRRRLLEGPEQVVRLGLARARPRGRLSSAGSRASRAAGCRRACATPARTASATARRRSRTSCSSPTAIRTRIRRRCSRASSGRPSTPCTSSATPHDLRRSRVTVFFRLLLAIPHLVWLVLWGDRARSSPRSLNWFVTLFTGTPPRRSTGSSSRVRALPAARVRVPLPRRQPVPGLRRRAGDATRSTSCCRRRHAQNRWKTGLPDLPRASRRSIVNSALSWGLVLSPRVLTWFVALARGAAPWGLRNFSAYALRYDAQVERVPRCSSPTCTRTRARSKARRRRSSSSPNRRGVSRQRARSLLALLAARLGGRRRGSSGSRRCRRRCTCRTSTSIATSPRRSCTRPRRFSTRQRPPLLGLRRSRSSRRSPSSRAGAGASRASRRPARSAPGCCSACSASRSSGSCSCPFGVVDLWWQRRHHLTHVGYADFALRQLVRARRAVRLPLLRARDRHGSRAQAAADAGGSPPRPRSSASRSCSRSSSRTSSTTHRLDDPQLRAVATRLERSEHVGHVPIVVENVHDVTSLPNAEATGSARAGASSSWTRSSTAASRRRELTVVIAHELGHLARNHIWKDVGWYALFAFPGTFLHRAASRAGAAAWASRRPCRSRCFVLVVLQTRSRCRSRTRSHVTWRPRRTGRRSQATRDPAAATALFRRFVPTTLDEPNPSTCDYLVLENHPTIVQRIAHGGGVARYATSAAQSP